MTTAADEGFPHDYGVLALLLPCRLFRACGLLGVSSLLAAASTGTEEMVRRR